jgi:DNA-binding MarR family transcriptional regulator
MSMNNDRDVRTQLTREKYFSLRPKPLERWIWQQGIPQAAERVFWVHWEEGMRRGDWCSELALRQVARECAVDTSTVTRAYQALRRLGLIRREDPGRDPENPFRQAIAITEVLLPRELLQNLARYPNRSKSLATAHARGSAPVGTSASVPISGGTPTPVAAEPQKAPAVSRTESKALMVKLSAAEQQEFFLASRDRRTSMTFDARTALEPEERGRVLELLARISGSTPSIVAAQTAAPRPVATQAVYAKTRKLSPLEAARVRAGVLSVSPANDGAEVFRQVLWSMEEGALRRFDTRLALNIALKKIREGAWTRPNRLPPNWLANARSEACSAA